MDPQKWSELSNLLLSSLQAGKDFALEQTPLFVQEYLRWRIAEDIFWICFSLIIALVGVLLTWWARLSRTDWHEKEVQIGIFFVGIGITIFSLGAGVSPNVYDLVKVKVAPRVVILEGIRDTLLSDRR